MKIEIIFEYFILRNIYCLRNAFGKRVVFKWVKRTGECMVGFIIEVVVPQGFD